MTDTPYHDQAKPEPGGSKGTWGQELNSIIDYYDEQIALIDEISERPSSSDAPDDALFLATDQGLLYRNDASNGWVAEPFGDENSRVPGTSYFEKADAEEIATEAARTTGTDNITLNVPSDLDTVQEAIQRASEYVDPRQGVTIRVNIESGYEIDTNIQLKDQYLAHVELVSEGAVVDVENGFTGNLFEAENTICPVWKIAVDMGGDGANGIDLKRGCWFTTDAEDGAGVRNAGNRGFEMDFGNNSDIRNADFTGAGDRPLNTHQSDIVNANNADFSDGGDRIRVGNSCYANLQDATINNSGGNPALDIQHNTAATCRRIEITGGSGTGLTVVESCIVDATDATLDNNGSRGAVISGSLVWLENGSLIGNYGDNIHVLDNASVFAENASFDNSTNGNGALIRNSRFVSPSSSFDDNGETGIDAQSSDVFVRDVSVNGNDEDGIETDEGTRIVFAGNGTTINENANNGVELRESTHFDGGDATIDNNGNHGVTSLSAPQGSLRDATITNNGGHGIQAVAGGFIGTWAATITGNTSDDLRVRRGSIIAAWDTQTSSTDTDDDHPEPGDTNISTFNDLTEEGAILAPTNS